MLNLVGKYDISSIQNTINSLTQKSINVNVENIKMILDRKNDSMPSKLPKSEMQEKIIENSKRHLSMYDAIIGTSNVEGGVAV